MWSSQHLVTLASVNIERNFVVEDFSMITIGCKIECMAICFSDSKSAKCKKF